MVFIRKTNEAARAARTLVRVFDVVWEMTTWQLHDWKARKHSNGNENVTSSYKNCFKSFRILEIKQERADQKFQTNV